MEKNKNLVIFGAGETAQLAYEYFKSDSEYEVVAFAVDPAFRESKTLCDLPLLTIEEATEKHPPSNYLAFAAASSTQLNRVRTNMYNMVKKLGYDCATYTSSRSFIWHNVDIGENCFILEDNTLQPFTAVGNNVVMWSGNHLGHRSKIRDHCFISSHCVISGFCEIGESSFLGVNCTLEDRVTIGEDNFIGANTIIRKSTEERSLFQADATQPSKISTHRLYKIRTQKNEVE